MQPTYTELVEQLADLRTRIETPLTLDDLPLHDLRAQLIENGEPLDLSVLGLIGQVANFGADGVKIRWGVATMTWAGGVSLATLAGVAHGLEKVPKIILVTTQANGQGQAVAAHAGNYSTTTFEIQADFVGGFTPAAGATLPVCWLALAV